MAPDEKDAAADWQKAHADPSVQAPTIEADPDIGITAAHAALVPLMDKLDAEKAAIRAELDAAVLTATAAAKRGDYVTAAREFSEIAAAWRAHHFPGEAEVWERRATDCREVTQRLKRAARKGKVLR